MMAPASHSMGHAPVHAWSNCAGVLKTGKADPNTHTPKAVTYHE